MDISMIVRKQHSCGCIIYLTKEMEFSDSPKDAFLYVSGAAFTDAELTDAEVFLRFVDGREMPVSEPMMFHPSCPGLH